MKAIAFSEPDIDFTPKSIRSLNENYHLSFIFVEEGSRISRNNDPQFTKILGTENGLC